jgi:GxxExxY protein
MSTTESKVLNADLSYKIVGLAMEVHRELGFGFLEKVYENSLMILLRREGIPAAQQHPIEVKFRGESVGIYYPDILVNEQIILEIKSLERLTNADTAQALNYLKATGLRLAILLNFGKERLDSKRLVR